LLASSGPAMMGSGLHSLAPAKKRAKSCSELPRCSVVLLLHTRTLFVSLHDQRARFRVWEREQASLHRRRHDLARFFAGAKECKLEPTIAGPDDANKTLAAPLLRSSFFFLPAFCPFPSQVLQRTSLLLLSCCSLARVTVVVMSATISCVFA